MKAYFCFYFFFILQIILEFWIFWNYLQIKEMIKTEVSHLFLSYINFLCEFSFYSGCLMNFVST